MTTTVDDGEVQSETFGNALATMERPVGVEGDGRPLHVALETSKPSILVAGGAHAATPSRFGVKELVYPVSLENLAKFISTAKTRQ